MDDAVARGGVGQAPAPGDVDRLEALEQQVRQLTSRLAGWVEAQLVQAVDDRRNDMKALRSELQVILNEQLAGMRAEASSVLSVATRRLEVGQEQLTERLDAVAERAADAAATAMALSSSPSGDSERLDALEQRVRSAMSRLSDSVETRLTELDKARQSELDALRSQLRAIDDRVSQQASAAGLSALSTRLDQRLDEVGGQVAAAADRVASLSAEVDAGPARIDAFEQRVKAAMVRLTDSVELRLAETATTRSSDLVGLRSELTKRIDEMARTRSNVTGRVDAVAQRISAVADDLGALRVEVKAGMARNDELEKRVKAAIGRLADSVETKLADFAAQSTEENTARLAEVAEQRRGELEAFNASVQATLRESEVRLRQMIQVNRGDFEAIAGRVAKLSTVTEKVDALTTTAAVEAGSLAPLRSDLRLLQGQVAELAEVVAELRPRRKPAVKKVVAPAKKVAARKAARRKAQ